MRRRLHPLFALLLALLLIGSQQAAFAHMLGHAAVPAPFQNAQAEDVDHGTALALSHVCTTCIAFAGADAALPASLLGTALAAGQPRAPAVAVPPAPTLRRIAAFHGRAPPLL